MPNHVTTRCVVTGPGEEIARFRRTCIRPEGPEPDDTECLDFNTIIPMPEVLKGTQSGSNASLGIEALTGSHKGDRYGIARSALSYPWVKEQGIETAEQLRDYLERTQPESLEEGRKALAAHEQTGYYDWYDWCCDKWGTEWNSYSYSIDENLTDLSRFAFQFDTAWSFPEPIFHKLTEMFPTLNFECCCYDEGGGFAGEGSFSADEVTFQTCDATDELYEKVYGAPPEREEDEEPVFEKEEEADGTRPH